MKMSRSLYLALIIGLLAGSHGTVVAALPAGVTPAGAATAERSDAGAQMERARREMERLEYDEDQIAFATSFVQSDDPELLEARKTFQELLDKYKAERAPEQERVRELGLRDVFRVQELLKAFVHSVILNCYKSNETKVIIQVLQRGCQNE